MIPWSLLTYMKDGVLAFAAGSIIGGAGVYACVTEFMGKDLVDRGSYLTKEEVRKNWIESSAYETCLKNNNDWKAGYDDLKGKGCDAALTKERNNLFQNCSIISTKNNIENQIYYLQRDIDHLFGDYQGLVDPSSVLAIEVAQRRERIAQKQSELQVLDGKLQ